MKKTKETNSSVDHVNKRVLLQRLCWNSNGWRGPTGERYQKENSYVGQHGFGHEEWNLNTADLIDDKVYGYIYYNPPPSAVIPLRSHHHIYFFTIAPDKKRLLVGAYRNASFLKEEERLRLKERLEGSPYLDRRANELVALGLPHIKSEQDALRLLVFDFALNVFVEPEDVITFSPPPLLKSADVDGRDPQHLNRYKNPVFLDKAPTPDMTQLPLVYLEPGMQQDLLEDSYVRFTTAQRRVIIRRHNSLSKRFKIWLAETGATTINVESESVDISCGYGQELCLFELKTCYNQSTRHTLREALGQVLEYAFYPGRTCHQQLAVVLDATPAVTDIHWFRRLGEIPIAVELFWLVGNSVYSPKLTDHPLAKHACEFSTST